MTILQMGIRNFIKKFSFHSLYLTSVAFVITVYFSFTSFSMNNVMLEKISTDGRVEAMCNIISIFLMIFVIFYMSYSNRFFLRRRTKELGIFTLLGYRKSTILSLLLFENLITCTIALFIGLIFGAFSHKIIVFLISELLNLQINLSKIQLFNILAVRKTVGFILIVIFILGLSNIRFMYKSTLISLVRFEKSSEKIMKFRKNFAFLGFLMILVGYLLSLDILRGINSFWVTMGFYQIGLMTLLLVVIGTVLFIMSFLPYIMKVSKGRKETFYTSTKIITTSNFIYRIRSNAKTFVMLTLLSSATLTISSVMAITLYYPIASVARIAPSDIEFRVENNSQIKEVNKIIEQFTTDKSDHSIIKTDIYRVTTTTTKGLPIEYTLGTSKGQTDNNVKVREEGFECISYTQYRRLLKAQNNQSAMKSIPLLNDNDAILMKYQADGENLSKSKKINLNINGEIKNITFKTQSLHNAISFANSVGTIVVSDKLYSRISNTHEILASVISLNGSEVSDNEKLYSSLSRYLNKSPYLIGHNYRINSLLFINSSTFLLIGFLVVLFFIAVGSILYFNNISIITDSKSDYDILGKMGYTNLHMKKIIQKQVLVSFGVPFTLGLLNSIFATLVYKIGLMQNILGNSFNQYIPVIVAVTLTFIIYSIYYFITLRSCYKIALE